jgi:pimeloyl-ACP methyl ester carboxylesterase
MKHPLLLLHGALGSKNQFQSIQNSLEEKVDVYSLNFEGHGGTGQLLPYSMDSFSKNVIDFLEEHSLEKVNIFGYSMGGYVALNCALKIPERIEQIITLGTKFDWSLEAAEKEVRMLDPEKIEEKVPQFAEKLRKVHQPHDWKAVVTNTAEMMMNLALGEKLTDADLKKIDIPVTIGIGTMDNIVTLEESEHASELLLHANLVKLSDVQHPIEKVQSPVLVEFISSNLKLN